MTTQFETKRNLIEERMERERVAIELFEDLFKRTNEAFVFDDIFSALEEDLSGVYKKSTLRALFTRLTKEGNIKTAHTLEEPTSILFTKQKLYPAHLITDTSTRTWLTSNEKLAHMNVFQKKYTTTQEQIEHGLVKFVGAFETKEENMAFLAELVTFMYQTDKRAVTTDEIIQFLCNQKNSFYEVLKGSIHEAKSRNAFQTVSLKSKPDNAVYVVPHMDTRPHLKERDWLYKHESRKLISAEINQKIAEVHRTQDNEPNVFASLLEKGKLDVYLFMKIHRVFRYPKSLLVDLKVSDYNSQNQSIHLSVDNISYTLELDDLTNTIIQRWLQVRETYPTAESEYFFINAKSSKYKDSTALFQRFKKEAKKQDFTITILYRDISKSRSLPFRLYALLEGKNTRDEIIDSKLDWFFEIEKEYIKNMKM